MKTPTVLKVFAIFNLIIALTGMLGSAYFIYELSYDYDNPAIYIMVFCMAAGSAWLLFAGLSWLFSFQTANVLIFTSVLSIIAFLGAVLEAFIQMGLQSKVEMQMLSLLFTGFGTYTLFLVSSIFFKPVREWRAAYPEMKRWTWPVLILFLIVTFGGVANMILIRPSSSDYLSVDTRAMEIDDGVGDIWHYPDSGNQNIPRNEAYGTPNFDEGYEYGQLSNDQTVYPGPQVGLPLNTSAISQLLNNFFHGFASSEWNRKKFLPDYSLPIYDENDLQYGLGMYLAGPRSVYEIYYDHFLQNFSESEKQNCAWPHWPCHFESLSGINPILKKADELEKFNHYNPEFIRWFYTYMIPEPTTEILSGLTAQDVYAKVFRRLLRIYTLSYAYLNYIYLNKPTELQQQYLQGVLTMEELKRGRQLEELQQYQQAVLSEQYFDAINYLRERYKGVLSNYESQDYSQQLEPALAIGFRLRRGIDGTDKDCWLGLQKAMNKYDPIWFHRTLAEYGLEANARVNNP